MIKKLFALVLVITIIFLNVFFADSAQTDAQVYSVYGDNMLFKQNEEAVIAGTGSPGSQIRIELLDKNENLIAENTSEISNEGMFELSFQAPSGSFEAYTVILKQNGDEFEKLENVVFGELWLASGQSNMQYPLGQAKYGVEMMENSEKLSKYLRVLITPDFSELNETVGVIPSEPQKDIPGSEWITGEDSTIYGMSAVAYFFADKMINELKMPVGILNVSLGGSTIASWLSRDEIERNENVKNDFINYDKYVDADEWDNSTRSIYYEMSTNYNLRIEALKNFNLSGMIWYQGETDIIWSAEAYSRAFDLLQRSYTELFGYSNGLLPIIFTQLASYFYSDDGFDVPARNVDFAEIQQCEPNSRALVSIYDVPLTYIPAAGVIHPECKLEVGERMAFSALGLVYGRYDSYTASTVKNTEIKDGAVFVTLRDVGDGLVQNEEILKGFSVCGEDGIYVKADAEIIRNDTVKIFCEDIDEPHSAAYAYSDNNEKSNLYASKDGEITLPVSPFVTDRTAGTKYWSEKNWSDCDDETIWHTINDIYSGFYPSWGGNNAELIFASDNENKSFLSINSDEKKFNVSPVLTYKNGNNQTTFNDTDSDYSSYGKITFEVKNDGSDDVTLSEIRFSRSDLLWHSPAVEDTSGVSVNIPADGKWHTVTFNLNKLYCCGFDSGFSYSNNVLTEVKKIYFCFESENENSSISIDSIRFSPSEAECGIGFDADLKSSENVFEFFSALLVNFIGMIVSVFR